MLARIVELGELVHGPRAAALVRHAQAVADGDAGLTHIALRELGEAGLWLPAQGSRRVALTRREREIAGLAAGGLSSKAIAERFTLSVRTVDSHLSRVFTKLGVRSRRARRGPAGLTAGREA
ncbi:helix-turn-helix transcriptional regulator [Georgenia yuyongxinii]